MIFTGMLKCYTAHSLLHDVSAAISEAKKALTNVEKVFGALDEEVLHVVYTNIKSNFTFHMEIPFDIHADIKCWSGVQSY